MLSHLGGTLRVAIVALLVAGIAGAAAAVEPTPDPVRARLLNRVPHYGKVLREQWSSEVAPADFEDEAAHYGLLDETAQPRSITLEESIALALGNNTGLRIQKLNPIAATARVRQALSQFDPAVFGDAGKSRTNYPVLTISPFTTAGQTELFDDEVVWDLGVRKQLLTGGLFAVEWTNSRQSQDPTIVNLVVPQYYTALGASITQPILRNFGWRFALLVVDVAELGEEQAFFDYKAQVANLIATVEQAYWVYVLAIENVRVEEHGMQLARELLRQNEGRFKVGTMPRTAVLESEAEVARRDANLVRVRALQRITRDNLRALINAREGDADALLMIEPADRPTVVPAAFDLARSLDVAYKERPELIAARLNVDGRKVERKIAENRLLPRFDFVGGIGLTGLGGNDSGLLSPTPAPSPGLSFQPNPGVLGGYGRALELLTDGRYYQYQFGAVFEVPLANADAKARLAEAKVRSENARLSLQQLEEQVTLDITQAVNNMKALLRSAEATRIARELAAENVRNQQARYEVGLGTTKDLIDFQDRLTQAERAEIEALSNYNIELARLRRADGTLLRERNVQLERAGPEPPPWWARF